MTYLKRIKAQKLKIDREFTGGILDDIDDEEIVRATIALAGAFGMSLIAEGVETDQQKQCLIEMGCPSGQGYLFSKPLLAEEFESWYSRLAS